MTAVGKSCPIERERDLAHWVLKLTVSQAAIPTYGRFLRQFGRAIDMSGVAHEKRGSMSELGHVWTAPGWQGLSSRFAALVGAAMCPAF
jgi:hypothetical protein